MKRLFYIILFTTICSISFAIIDSNDYLDINLKGKDGTFALPSYHRDNYFFTFCGVDTKGYAEFETKTHLNINSPELFGFIFAGDIYVGYTKDRDVGGEFEKFGGITMYYGEAYLGYENKFTSVRVGFQNLNSSDAIYNHLQIDDYGGPIFALKFTQFMSRFVDMEIVYSFIRPHTTDWNANFLKNDIIDGQFGKSLFYKKFNIRPLPWIRIGLGDSVYFLGNNFNIYYMNPLGLYFMTLAQDKFWEAKYGAESAVDASSLKIDLDFNIGFNGWRFYGEMLIDDSDGFFVTFKPSMFPNRVAFVLGGELRGCLFTRYIHMSKPAEFFIGNMYINLEYGVTSKYCYTRDNNNNYEYVRQEYRKKYSAANPMTTAEIKRIQRQGNFLGFMYGNNADCFDIAIGWRNDLEQTQSYIAGYQNDRYFDAQKQKKEINRLFKVQLHYRHYRLGDERNVVAPFYANEHYYFDVDKEFDSDGDGIADNDTSNRRTEFLRIVEEQGDIFDINIYSDLFRIARFTMGMETKFNFIWQTYHPLTIAQQTDFTFKWEIAFVVSWH